MNYQNPHFQAYGEQAVLIVWEEKINGDLLNFILSARDQIEMAYRETLVEVINTYHSLLIKYSPSIKNITKEIPFLQNLIGGLEAPQKAQAARYHLPVCYDEKFGLDLTHISVTNSLKISEIQQLHTAADYIIYFIGFLPGFLYLGGLNKKLFCNRKEMPRKKVKKGAVGIGGKQTGIYPVDAPGGWQLIGNCPVPVFNVQNDPPVIFKPGDHIRFYPVSLEEYRHILAEAEKGVFSLQKEDYVR